MGDVHTNLRLAYYGDDFTGSTDALEFLTRAGLRTRLYLTPPSIAQCAGLDAVGVAGLTRSMSPEAMETELRPAFTALRALGAPHVHYKVCSTFDSSPLVGSIGRAIDVGAEIFRSRFVPLLVGAPDLGRYCVFGNLFAQMGIGSSGEIYRLDRNPSMSQHPVTSADESDLRRHLARQTAKRVALFDILHVALPKDAARAALDQLLKDAPDVVLFDLLFSNQLATIGALLDERASRGVPLFTVGSSGVEAALTAHWRSGVDPAGQTHVAQPDFPKPNDAEPLLVISGSCSPVTQAQIRWAAANGFAEIALDAAALGAGADPASFVASIVAHLQAGRHVIAHTTGETNQRREAISSSTLGNALGLIACGALAQTGVRRLVIAGGDSSSYAARALGIEAVDMIAPLAPGAPLCRALAPGSSVDGREVNFKGGQVGAPDYFGAVVRGRL